MVKVLSKIIYLSVLLLILYIPAVSAQLVSPDSELSASISIADKQWGQYINATLRYRGPLKLENIDLTAWRQIAMISLHNEYVDEDKQGRPVQVAKLRLYPRGAGTYQLSALKLGVANSAPIKINISQAIVEAAPIKLQWQVSATSPWQRQNIIIRVHLQTADDAAHVLLDAIEHPSFISRPLHTERHTLPDGEYRYDAGWILYPIDAGRLSLSLPPVRYQLSGSDRRRFYLPVLTMDVKALPAYLPPTLPVGKLTIYSDIKPSRAGENRWHINIDSDALIPYGIPGLDTQLASISQQDIATVKINNRQQSDYSQHRSHSNYVSFLPIWQMPFSKENSLTLRYFDPVTGRLQETTHTLPASWNMPVWAWWATITFTLIFGAYLIWKIRPWVASQWDRLTLHRELRSATSVQQMRHIVLEHSQCLTLSEWAVRKQINQMVIHELNKYCFSPATITDIQGLKTSLLKAA